MDLFINVWPLLCIELMVVAHALNNPQGGKFEKDININEETEIATELEDSSNSSYALGTIVIVILIILASISLIFYLCWRMNLQDGSGEKQSIQNTKKSVRRQLLQKTSTREPKNTTNASEQINDANDYLPASLDGLSPLPSLMTNKDSKPKTKKKKKPSRSRSKNIRNSKKKRVTLPQWIRASKSKKASKLPSKSKKTQSRKNRSVSTKTKTRRKRGKSQKKAQSRKEHK